MKNLLIFILILCIPQFIFGTTYYKQVDFLMSGYRNSTDSPLSGGKVYVYEAFGMTTPMTLYSDRTGSTPLPNPIILDTYGRAEAYGNGVYRFVIKTSEEVSVETVDGYECYSNSADATTSIVESIETIETKLNGLKDIYLKLDTSNDPLTGDLNAGGNGVQFLNVPNLTHEAVNKEYADGYVGGIPLTDEALSDGDILQYESADQVFEKRSLSTIIGSNIGTFIKVDYGTNLTHGSYAQVNGNTSTGTQIEYYTGYTTYFILNGWALNIGYTDPTADLQTITADISIDQETGLATCTSDNTYDPSNSNTTTGSIDWIAISIKD